MSSGFFFFFVEVYFQIKENDFQAIFFFLIVPYFSFGTQEKPKKILFDLKINILLPKK